MMLTWCMSMFSDVMLIPLQPSTKPRYNVIDGSWRAVLFVNTTMQKAYGVHSNLLHHCVWHHFNCLPSVPAHFVIPHRNHKPDPSAQHPKEKSWQASVHSCYHLK